MRFVDALPKSTVGKILRRELRDLGLSASHRRSSIQQPTSRHRTRSRSRHGGIFETQRQACLVNPPPDAGPAQGQADRRCARCCSRYQDPIAAAVSADFGGRAPAETKLVEVLGPMLEINHALHRAARLDEAAPALDRTAVPRQQRCASTTSPRAWSASSAPGTSRCTWRSARWSRRWPQATA